MLTLYNAEWCPDCARVRHVLTELGLSYTCVNVPRRPEDRKEVFKVSNQYYIPVLVDGDTVLTDEGNQINDYLIQKYGNKSKDN